MEHKYPSGEIVWVRYYDSQNHLRYIMTSKPTRDYYYLYELQDGRFVKLGRNKSPIALEEKFVDLE